jgi:O-antigen ligase
MAITAVMTILGENIVMGGSKVLTGGAETADITDISAAVDAGIGAYGNNYGMGLLIFPLLYSMTFMKWGMKVFLVCISLLFIMTSYVAGYSILMIGLSLAGFIYLLVKIRVNLKTVKIVGVITIACLVTVVAKPTLISSMITPLQRLGDMITHQEYQYRINSVIDTVSGDSASYAAARSELYWESWETFLEYPIFGIGRYDFKSSELRYKLGGHSTIFDILGSAGIAGLSIFILIFFFHYRYLRLMSAVVLGYKWWPAYYIFMFPFFAIAFINPLEGNIIFSNFLLYIPSMAFFFKTKDANVGGQRLNPYTEHRV